MPIELKMPALSPTMEEGTLAKWIVKEGDSVVSGDLLAEIETDKATMEFEAVDEGIIASILVPEGTDNVKVGEVIAMIAEEGEDVSVAASAPAIKETGNQAASENASVAVNNSAQNDNVKASPLATRMAAAADVDLSSVTGTGPKGKIVKADIQAITNPTISSHALASNKAADGGRIIASPLARRIAAERGVDLAQATGTGPNGRIIKVDVETAERVQASAPAQTASTAPAITAAQSVDAGDIPHSVEKLSNMRKTIARRLTEAKQTIPHIYLTVDIQLDKLLEVRKEINASLESQGIKLSVNDLLIKALAKALIAVPKCNVSFAGDTLIKYERADISVAVSMEGGLITPIITGADSKSVSVISSEMKELAGKAREGKLMPHEYQGGTASISNMGMFGIKQFDAVINPPQAMIMAISAGEQRPYVVNGELSVATVMSVTGSFDHRAIDGADGAELMKTFKALIENPLGMLV